MPRRWADLVERRARRLRRTRRTLRQGGGRRTVDGRGTHGAHRRAAPDVAGCVFINPLVKGPRRRDGAGTRRLIDSGVESMATDRFRHQERGRCRGEVRRHAASLRCRASSTAWRGVNAQLSRDHRAEPAALESRGPRRDLRTTATRSSSKSSGPVERIWLEESYHVATMDNDQELVESRDAGVPRARSCVMARRFVARTSRTSPNWLDCTLSEAELDMFTEQLGQVLEHANDMNALDLEGVVPTAHPFGLVNVVREDVRASVSRPRRGAWPWRPTPRTAASPCRASWARRREDRAPDRPRRAERRTSATLGCSRCR